MAKKLMKGNEAVAASAIAAGCKCFFGYPITPQNEIPEFMSHAMFDANGVFIQAESEVAAINMVYGAGGAGVRVMTSSSSPGIALKQEGISYLAGSQIPAVIVNMMRGGPGLGSIQSAQADYNMMVKGGGNGDYRCITLAPGNIQEACDMVMEAFDLADYYRNPVFIAADGTTAQMMEPVEINYKPKYKIAEKTWAANGSRGKRERNIINSLFLDATDLYKHNLHLQEKYKKMESEARAEDYRTDDAEVVIVSYGIMSRISRGVIDTLRKDGKKVGMIRPQTLWPFPVSHFQNTKHKMFIAVESSAGQLVDDVRLACSCRVPVHHFGEPGLISSEDTILKNIKQLAGGLL